MYGFSSIRNKVVFFVIVYSPVHNRVMNSQKVSLTLEKCQVLSYFSRDLARRPVTPFFNCRGHNKFVISQSILHRLTSGRKSELPDIMPRFLQNLDGWILFFKIRLFHTLCIFLVNNITISRPFLHHSASGKKSELLYLISKFLPRGEG